MLGFVRILDSSVAPRSANRVSVVSENIVASAPTSTSYCWNDSSSVSAIGSSTINPNSASDGALSR